jgi:hypothetical protein
MAGKVKLTLLVLVLFVGGCSTSTARAQTLRYLNCVRLPVEKARGLSGITYAGGDTYWGVLEWESRLVRMKVKLDSDGSIASATIESSVKIDKESDFEGVAFHASRPGRVMVSNDEVARVAEVNLADGKTLRELPMPAVFKTLVPNQGFESLTYSVDGKSLWTANERALKADGNPGVAVQSFLTTTRVRLLRFDVSKDAITAAEQYEYETSGIHGLGGQIGLCDLAALPDGRLLALERSAAMNLQRQKSIRTRIFLADVSKADDVSKPPTDKGLVGKHPKKVEKKMLYDDFVCDADGENLEGLCLGPKLGKDKWVVLGVVDNTDGGVGVSSPAVVAFELDLNAKPATQPTTKK